MSDTIIIGGVEFTKKCPEWCPGRKELLGMGSVCFRCPRLNCIPDADGFSMMKAEHYRPDWAKEWKAWFDGLEVEHEKE